MGNERQLQLLAGRHPPVGRSCSHQSSLAATSSALTTSFLHAVFVTGRRAAGIHGGVPKAGQSNFVLVRPRATISRCSFAHPDGGSQATNRALPPVQPSGPGLPNFTISSSCLGAPQLARQGARGSGIQGGRAASAASQEPRNLVWACKRPRSAPLFCGCCTGCCTGWPLGGSRVQGR